MNKIVLEDFSMECDGLYCGDYFLAPFNPILEKVICLMNLDSEEVKYNYLVKVQFTNGKEVEGHLFSSLSNIHYFEVWNECCDACIKKKQKDLLYMYLQLQTQKAQKEEQYCYEGLGLHENIYVFDKTNAIVMSSEEKAIYVPGNEEIPDFKYKSTAKDEKIQYLCKLLTVKKGTSEILFLCRLFSVLRPLLQKEGYQTGFVTTLYGRSGVGKTQLARTFFVQHSGQEKNFKLNSRDEIESTLGLFDGHTVLIDDYHPESLDYGRKRQESILDFLARKSDDGIGALSVITAEFLSGCFSVQDRMLQLKIEGNDLNFVELKYLQANSEILTSILKDFAGIVYCKREDVVRIVKNTMGICSIKESNWRVSFVIRLLQATLEVFWELCLDDADKVEIKRKLGDDKIKETLFAQLDNVEKAQIKHMKHLKRMEEDVDWIQVLYEMLYIDQFFSICPELDNLDNPKYGGMAVLTKKNKIHMSSQTLKNGLEQCFGRKVSIKPLINALLEEHILDEDKSSSHMKKKSNGRYYYVIDESLLELYYQNQIVSKA